MKHLDDQQITAAFVFTTAFGIKASQIKGFVTPFPRREQLRHETWKSAEAMEKLATGVGDHAFRGAGTQCSLGT